MPLEPAGDLASDVAVQAALRDFPGSVAVEGPASRRPAVSAESLPRRDDELHAARDVMLDAIAVRPGWAYHRFLLGRVATAAAEHSEAPVPAGRHELWAGPLRQAAAAAPGLDAIWVSLAGAYLDHWPELPPTMRAQATAVMRRAFLDWDFLSRGFSSALATLGPQKAVALLPETPHALEVAARALSREGNMQDAALLMARKDRAEREDRAADLRRIEQRYHFGDIRGLRIACLSWVSEHPPGDFDDSVGRAQAARVLELYPSDRGGSWRSDPRADLVRFFLNGRESQVKREALARALESLSGVPEAILARGKVLVADLEGAEELASKSQDLDSLDWVPYFVELARLELKRGRPRDAQRALARLAAGAREDCDVLLTRRDVARALRDSAELEAVEETLKRLRVRSHSVETEPGSLETALSFCLDPDWAKGRVLIVQIEVAAPAVLVYGWDGGRSGTLLASESSTILRVPLTGLSGRNFSVRAALGGPVRELRAAVTVPTG